MVIFSYTGSPRVKISQKVLGGGLLFFDSHCRYKNERSVAFKRRQNRFSVGAVSRGPRGESSRRSLRPSSRLGREHSSPYSTPLSTDHLRRSPCVPQKSSQIYAYARYDSGYMATSGSGYISKLWIRNLQADPVKSCVGQTVPNLGRTQAIVDA